MNTKNRINSKLLRLTTIAIGTFSSYALMAQNLAPMTTNVSGPVNGPFTITQSGSGDPTEAGGILFQFDRLDTVDGGTYANYDLLAVTVRIFFEVGSYNLTLSNSNQENELTFAPTNNAGLRSDFLEFSLGANTSDGSSPIASGDFPGQLLQINLENESIPAGSNIQFPGSFDSRPDEVRQVSSAFFDQYEGLGVFDFLFRTEFNFTTNVSGSDFSGSFQVTDTSFFTEVEYIVIPEPGTIALMVIAFGGAAGMTLLRRRKRD
ncbi:MAG: PEP-CTERM sorting domain-containing protein [Verrucomicrobia bacterium]|nr:PEP-CTERM sorting domain-containing protein [Verrucomicrobiota bacterium]MCH8514660.1 PEP-CTERM sorting domain-containing protein [Kiritimatiellia bacterium]